MAQLVERVLGKDEVLGSNPRGSSGVLQPGPICDGPRKSRWFRQITLHRACLEPAWQACSGFRRRGLHQPDASRRRREKRWPRKLSPERSRTSTWAQSGTSITARRPSRPLSWRSWPSEARPRPNRTRTSPREGRCAISTRRSRSPSRTLSTRARTAITPTSTARGTLTTSRI